MQKISFIVGIDEVGRGPLAGPVTVCAVAVPFGMVRAHKTIFKDIKDSKHLTKLQREAWYSRLVQHDSVSYVTASVSHTVIDAKGISAALKLAVALAIKRLHQKTGAFTIIYLDGSLYAPIHYTQKTIIKGDEKVPIIAAASIIAKVTRDRLMVSYSKKWPQYDFDKHKGYGTRKHYKALHQYGPLSIHRRSFLRKMRYPK